MRDTIAGRSRHCGRGLFDHPVVMSICESSTSVHAHAPLIPFRHDQLTQSPNRSVALLSTLHVRAHTQNTMYVYSFSTFGNSVSFWKIYIPSLRRRKKNSFSVSVSIERAARIGEQASNCNNIDMRAECRPSVHLCVCVFFIKLEEKRHFTEKCSRINEKKYIYKKHTSNILSLSLFLSLIFCLIF